MELLNNYSITLFLPAVLSEPERQNLRFLIATNRQERKKKINMVLSPEESETLALIGENFVSPRMSAFFTFFPDLNVRIVRFLFLFCFSPSTTMMIIMVLMETMACCLVLLFQFSLSSMVVLLLLQCLLLFLFKNDYIAK